VRDCEVQKGADVAVIPPSVVRDLWTKHDDAFVFEKVVERMSGGIENIRRSVAEHFVKISGSVSAFLRPVHGER